MAMTLLQLRDAAKDLCDHVSNPNVPDPTWTRWINDGIEKVFKLAVARNGGVFRSTFDFTLTAASNSAALPATFRRLLGVSADPTVPGQRRALRKYNRGERDSQGLYGPRRYDLVSSATGWSIVIEPFQLCAGNYRAYYEFGPTLLAADGDLMTAVLEPFYTYAVTWAATKALGKEESDTRDLYRDLDDMKEEIEIYFAQLDGDDANTVVDDDARGPAYWTGP